MYVYEVEARELLWGGGVGQAHHSIFYAFLLGQLVDVPFEDEVMFEDDSCANTE